MHPRKSRRGDSWIEALFALWFVVSILGQHPERSYDRVRNLDAIIGNAAIPNWRFFAPRPAVHDVHILYRLCNQDQTEMSEWRALHDISQRKFRYIFWAPHRRSEKAIFDVASIIRTTSPQTNSAKLKARHAAIELIHEFAKHKIPNDQIYTHFQLLVVRYAGHDNAATPEYDFLFEPEPLQ